MSKKQTMSSNLEELADQLADQPYSIEVTQDETTEGEPIFFVSHPELPGCFGQGETLEEAKLNLKEAAKEYILSLLEDGLSVPDFPKPRQITETKIE